jgi:hypothetical protein
MTGGSTKSSVESTLIAFRRSAVLPVPGGPTSITADDEAIAFRISYVTSPDRCFGAFSAPRALPWPPRSEDRTQSPAAVSQKWEYFGMWPETFGNFAPPLAKSGGWRPFAEFEKPAIGGHFSSY